MASVYAEFDALSRFQADIPTVYGQLEKDAHDKDDLIDPIRQALQEKLQTALDARAQARESAAASREALENAVRSASEFNATRSEESEPMVVSDFYYEYSEDCEERLECAERDVESAENAVEEFDNFVRARDDNRTNVLAAMQKHLQQSDAFFTTYIDTLTRAKRCITHGASGTAGSSLNTAMAGTRALTADETAQLAQTTEWELSTIAHKCTIADDGAIHYKTNNCMLEGQMHPAGVYFQRDRFTIRGVTIEGVFPVFDSLFEPPVMEKSMWSATGNKYSEQFAYCNKELKAAVATAPALRNQFSALQLMHIEAGETPAGFTWHHHQHEGRMQLVSKKSHNAAMNGASHTAGGALWCR